MSRVLQIGIVGAGRFAAEIVPTLQALPRVEVTGLCDVDVARAAKTGARFRVKHVFDSAEAMFDTLPFAGVVVATPRGTQFDPALSALQRGLHVLCGDPAGTRAPQTRQLSVTALRKGIVHTSVYPLAALTAAAVRRLRDGTIGTIQSVEATSLSAPSGEPVAGRPPADNVLGDLVPDLLTVVRAVLPRYPSSVRAHVWSTYDGQPPPPPATVDQVRIELAYASDVHATVQAALTTEVDGARSRIAILGSLGRMDITRMVTDDGARLVTRLAVVGNDPVTREEPGSRADALALAAAHWERAIRGVAWPTVSARSARAISELLDFLRGFSPTAAPTSRKGSR